MNLLLKADARQIPLKDESVDCVITSPPYWSLRKYDVPDLVWDGDLSCQHTWGEEIKTFKFGGVSSPKVHTHGVDNFQKWQHKYQFCLKCHAWRGQLGLEPTFELYLTHLLQCFDEVKRVLKPSGTLWVNLGDSYNSHTVSKEWAENIENKKLSSSVWRSGGRNSQYKAMSHRKSNIGIPDKCLVLIPYRFAIGMVERGWTLRNIIIWHKPNCMPQSVKDRFTVDFEPVFFFVKSKKYWFRQCLEPLIVPNISGIKFEGNKSNGYGPKTYSGNQYNPNNIKGRNKRCVWTIPTEPYPESHFATFPENLVEPMIRAGCPPGGVVLDPFCGTGTVIAVTERLGRIGIGFDLGYQELQQKRVANLQKELF